MASHSTLEGENPPSHPTSSTRSREGHPTNGPRRMVLSDPSSGSESKGQTPAPVTTPCFVYLLLCADGSFYIGCTSDLRDRERTHNEGFGAEHTASRRPVRLVYSEPHESWPAARAREAQLKHWSRAKKQALVDGNTSTLHALARRRG
jgi:putative endonuclease